MPVEIVAVESTELFVGPADAPDQLIRVQLRGDRADEGVGVTVEAAVARGEPRPAVLAALGGAEVVVVEMPVRFAPGTSVGTIVPATVTVSTVDGSVVRSDALLTVAEPGWTMFMVSHFHYDPVWWTTQAAYTSTWASGSPRMEFQQTGFRLVRAHLEMARHDPDYRFVLAETDYLKPYWDTHPEERDTLRGLIADGRCELLGGAYNEPNTNLTSAENTIRNLVYGIGFQRDVLGGDPRTAWQLDAFGHDPQFPGLAADAGLTASSWARGPFHQWGPLQTTPAEPFRDARVMQFPSEFEWIAPSGRGLLTAYMPAHYSAGWWMDSAPTLADAERAVYRIFAELKAVAATRNVLLPVGTDYSPPNKWVTEIHRDWAARYTWPRFVCAVPRDFLDAVRAELAASGRGLVPISRDMNPIYTGKDVSYIDTKQAQRAAEVQLTAAERVATFAALRGCRYPTAALDKAWRQLIYGAHHDGITGSESDQVYLDLLTGWREAWQIGRDVRGVAVRHLVSGVDGAEAGTDSGAGRTVVVVNGLSWPRTDVATVRLPAGWAAPGLTLTDETGVPVPVLAEAVSGDGSSSLTFLARNVPPTGWRRYHVAPAREPLAGLGWRSSTVDDVVRIGNERYELTVDAGHGGGVVRLVDRAAGRDLLPSGSVGNVLLVYDEYPQHPRYGEGPWHLLPKGRPPASSANGRAAARVERSALGERVVVQGRVGTADYRQEITLWAGVSRVDCVTTVDFRGRDQLLRLRWPTNVAGGLPISEVGDAVVGRGFAVIDADTAEAPWTLDNPAYSWFGIGSTARVDVAGAVRAIGVAELIAAGDQVSSTDVRDLVVALVRAGVTSTASVDTGSRYGRLDVDSNLPDVRISIGGPDRNAFTAAVLTSAGLAYADELSRQLDESGQALLWVPAERPLAEVWAPNADLSGVRALPVLVVAGRDEATLHAALADLAADLEDSTVTVRQPATLHPTEPVLDGYSVALLNRGLPGFAVDRAGALHLSLLRSCTGWPSGVWTDPPRRYVPDGSGFQLQHWTHRFEYALASGVGDWRSAGFVPAGQGFTAPLYAVAVPDARPTNSLLSVQPPGAAIVTAVKPVGNPTASGSAVGQDPAAGIAVRLYEPSGRPAEVRLRVAVPIVEAARADLLEHSLTPLPVSDGEVTVRLDGFGVTTVILRPSTVDTAGTATVPLAPAGEPAQPVYSRYWLHNAGPAPAGNLPITVHATPTSASGSGSFDLLLTAASALTDSDWSGIARVIVDDGWTAVPDVVPLALPAGEHAQVAIRVTPATDAPPGEHLVSVELEHAGQIIEDVVTVSVPGPARSATGAGGVDVELETLAVAVRPGGRASVRVAVTNRFRSPANAVLWLIGPPETWPLTPEWTSSVRLDGDQRRVLELPVLVPADTPAGSWWLLVKLGCAGQVRYSESVRLTVDPPRR